MFLDFGKVFKNYSKLAAIKERRATLAMGSGIVAVWRVWEREERTVQLTPMTPVLKHCSKYC